MLTHLQKIGVLGLGVLVRQLPGFMRSAHSFLAAGNRSLWNLREIAGNIFPPKDSVGAADDSLPGQAGGVVRTRLGLVDRQGTTWAGPQVTGGGADAGGRPDGAWRRRRMARLRRAGRAGGTSARRRRRGWLVAAAGLRVTRMSMIVKVGGK